MTALATVTPIDEAPSVRTNHVWLVEPRADDPERHIRTCRRDRCGLKKRSEQVDGEWLWLWLWPDREQGQRRNAPRCRGGEVVPAPVDSVPAPQSVLVAPPRPPVRVGACSICVPPCGKGARFYASGWRCEPPDFGRSAPQGGAA